MQLNILKGISVSSIQITMKVRMLRQNCLSILFLSSIVLCVALPTNNTPTGEIIANSAVNAPAIANTIAIDTMQNGLNEIESEYRIKYAEQMLTYMNRSVEPCDDFYEYACGNWKNVIPERYSPYKRSNINNIVYSLGEAIEQLLLQDSPPHENFKFTSEWNLTKRIYKDCLAAELYPLKKSEVYLEIIKSIGGFPAVDETWKADNFSWFNMSAHLTNYGAVGLIKEEILPIYPFPPYFKLPRLGFEYVVLSDNIHTNSSHELNEKRMRDYLRLYGVDDGQKIERIVADIFETWSAILNITDDFHGNLTECEVITAAMDINEFQQWNSYMEIAWNGTKFDLDEDTWPCHYFYNELDKVCNERKEAVANYLALKFIYGMDAHLQDTKFQTDYCNMMIQYASPHLLSEIYMNEYFDDEIRGEISDIVSDVRKSLREILEQADWLDKKTREQALMKEAAIKLYLGSYQNKNVTDRLIKQMQQLSYVEGNYELNLANLCKFRARQKRFNGLHHKEYDNTTIQSLEMLTGIDVNAFYYIVDNSIYVMAGILHSPVYHKAWPAALKFSTIGYLVGHEFTHSFDSVGVHFNSVGENNYWLSQKAGKVFDERKECFVNQYNAYKIPEINRFVDGKQTKDENIADSGGLREAFSAYQRHVKQLNLTPKDERMPGLDLTPEQLYFVGFAQLWCASYKERHYWEELTDRHTMGKFRILGAVTNIGEFSKAYNCPVGSKMNPAENKCRVW